MPAPAQDYSKTHSQSAGLPGLVHQLSGAHLALRGPGTSSPWALPVMATLVAQPGGAAAAAVSAGPCAGQAVQHYRPSDAL